MMGWLSRNSSTPANFIDKKRVEPGAAFSLLENHWKQAKAVMDNSNNAQTAGDALTVISHLNQMVSFLRLTRNEDPENSCKIFWIRNKCSENVLQWLHSLQIKGTLLEYEDEKKLVQTLESLCELASQDGELLGYKTTNVAGSSTESCIWDGACSLSSLLLEYSLKSDPSLGEPARNSFIILIQLSAKYAELEKCFSEQTGLELTNVVISGLSACFAQLPTFVIGTNEQMEPFVTQLKFVDAVTHSAPKNISLNIADCFSTAFLHAVILPALTQDEGNRSLQDDHFVTSLHEEIAIVTNYFVKICQHLTHPLLIKSLLVFIINNLLPVLLQRMNHQNVSVTVSTLGLLNALLNFYCEDLWYELILRHLMPQSYLMVSQRTVRLPEIDKDASLRFLSLIPNSVVEAMGPEAISYHYAQYLQNEMSRLPAFISQEFALTYESTNIDRNPVFPSWKWKYDGTDEFSSPLKSITKIQKQSESSDINQPQTATFPKNTERENNKTPNLNSGVVSDPLSIDDTNDPTTSNQQQPFTTISLLTQPTDEQLNSLGGASITTSEDHSNLSLADEIEIGRGSDGYGSWESSSNLENSASYGPFLDTLFSHLKNLCKLPPDMILMVTEIMSTLAGSRIPLLTSILLDTNLILQPSYTAFPLLLNRIRVELDQNLKNNANILLDVWSSFSKELLPFQFDTNSAITSSTSMNFMHSLSNSFDNSFGDNSFAESLKKKIANSSSLGPLLNNVFQRKSSTGSISRSPLPSVSSPRQEERNGSGEIVESRFQDLPPSPSNLQSYRNKTGQTSETYTSTPKKSQSVESIKIMSTRAIYFSHWLLEMASISHQLCWKRPT